MKIQDIFLYNLIRFTKESKLDYQILADLLGVSESTTHRWLTGKMFPDTKHIDKIAKIFKIEAFTLFIPRG